MTEGRAAPLTREQWLAECCKLAKVYEDNMTKALDEIEKKALALVNEVTGLVLAPPFNRDHPYGEALCRALEELEAEKAARAAEREQHEAFRQEVSDAVEMHCDAMDMFPQDTVLARFIIAKPDPLVEVCDELGLGRSVSAADELTAAIEKRGGKIVWEDK